LAQIKIFPKTMNGFYHETMQRIQDLVLGGTAGLSRWEDVVRLLQLILGAREAVSVGMLAEALFAVGEGYQGSGEAEKLEAVAKLASDVRATLQKMASFFFLRPAQEQEWLGPSQSDPESQADGSGAGSVADAKARVPAERVDVYHKSVRDWLTDVALRRSCLHGMFFVDVCEGGRLLGLATWRALTTKEAQLAVSCSSSSKEVRWGGDVQDQKGRQLAAAAVQLRSPAVRAEPDLHALVHYALRHGAAHLAPAAKEGMEATRAQARIAAGGVEAVHRAVALLCNLQLFRLRLELPARSTSQLLVGGTQTVGELFALARTIRETVSLAVELAQHVEL
jgi:hypothetical protein